MVYQDPGASFNPRMKVVDILTEPLINYGRLKKEDKEKKAIELLEMVDLPASFIDKYPQNMSGGQRQRLGVARAVATNPKLIIADEPVSALDLSVQAQVLNYMKKIQKQLGLSYIFISHDLGVVKHMCDHISIMYKGRFVETGTKEDIYKNGVHVYTKRLIAAIPDVNPSVREEKRIFRKKVELEYNESLRDYFDENGRVFDLIKMDGKKEHFVALDKGGK